MDANRFCVVRGGGDIATGVIWRLRRCGIPVVVTELDRPLTIRRTVSFSTAVSMGVMQVEGMEAQRADDLSEVAEILERGVVPVVISPEIEPLKNVLDIEVVVDARLAKSPLDTSISDAPFVVGLGPGFEAGIHCHAVIETNRGHRMGRVIWSGRAQPNTGTPGEIQGRGTERVIRATIEGTVIWHTAIGEVVTASQIIGTVENDETTTPIFAPFAGMLRGAIAPATRVTPGLKIADVDPRSDEDSWREISDKALAIGGGVVEAIFARGPR